MSVRQTRPLALAIGVLMLAAAPVALAATDATETRHRATGPYVLGAIVIAIVAIALVVQLRVGVRRANRRRRS